MKIHKRMENVPGRPVTSNCGTVTGWISEFVDFHLQPIVNCYFILLKILQIVLCKLMDLGDIPENAIICTMDG